jgi:hypothetical protein
MRLGVAEPGALGLPPEPQLQAITATITAG